MNAGVGIDQPNWKSDVEEIQVLLNHNLHRMKPLSDQLSITGCFDWRVKTRLAHFQFSVMRLPLPQVGRVLPRDATYNELLRGAFPPGTRVEQIIDPRKALLGKLASLQGAASSVNTPWTSEGLSPRQIREEEFIVVDHGGKACKVDRSICWELPVRGLGFVTYNRNDAIGNKKKKTYPPKNPLAGRIIPDQIGTRQTIDRIMTLGSEWYRLHPNRPLQIGDISFPGGYDTPDHDTHQSGQIVDVRPIRKDSKWGSGGNLNYNSPAYDFDLTKEFIRLILKLYSTTTIYFNDQKVIREFKGIVSYVSNHDDHLHIMFS